MSPSVNPFNAEKYKALMGGLDCREITLKEALTNKDKRIDSQFWTTIIPKNPKHTYTKIGNVLLTSQYGISIDMNTDKKGYPIFRMNELHHMLTDLEVEKYANISNIEYQLFSLQDKDVLFNRTNSYEWVGRTGIYYKNDNTPFIYASYLVKLIPDSNIVLPEYLTTFLNTKMGIKAIKARARQSVNQTNVNPEEVKEIEIPLLSMRFQRSIENLFIIANQKRVDARHLYDQAVCILHNHLKIKIASTYKPYSEKLLSASFLKSGRLDAEYFDCKYDHIESQVTGQNTIRNSCILYDSNFAPLDDVEYQYIELANVDTTGGISNVDISIGCTLPSRARRLVKAGQVIVSSIEGSLSSCALITPEFNNAICSTGFYVVSSRKYNSETLLLLFKSEAVQAILKKRCSGTILTAISKDEFENMPLPEVVESVQEEIANKIQESFELRDESKRLLNLSIKAVEMAIETDEESALLWLESQK